MPRRKTALEKQNNARFASAEIVRAIETVQAAGLTVYAVEISLTGSIKITTQPEAAVTKRPTKTGQVSQTEAVDETASVKKQA